MRFARKLELPCSARSYCSLWRTLAAAPGSGGVCPDAGAANSKSNEAINTVDERLAIVPSLAIYANKLASKPIWLIPAVGERRSSYSASCATANRAGRGRNRIRLTQASGPPFLPVRYRARLPQESSKLRLHPGMRDLDVPASFDFWNN